MDRLEDGTCVLYIDRHLVHEVTSPQAFEGLRLARPPRCAARTPQWPWWTTTCPTSDRRSGIAEPESRLQVETLIANVAEFGVPYIPLLDARQGIVHIVGPELGISLPGTTIVLRRQPHLHPRRAGSAGVRHRHLRGRARAGDADPAAEAGARTCWCGWRGELAPGVAAKDIVLAIIGAIGTAGGNGHVIEYAGSAIRALDMAGRMTICNMSIEAGARAGMIAPDEATFDYVRTRPQAPKGEALEQAIAYWRTLPSDAGARYDRVVELDAAAIAPMVSWGTNPEAVLTITAAVPDPASYADPAQADQVRRMLAYMDLRPGQKLAEVPIDVVFIGSCTNGRIEDMRAAAAVVGDRRVAPGVRAMVVPGSGLVKQQAEREGLDRVFTAAGFEWREAGCSMCLGMNPDRLTAGQRCASTSNRNFEGRQGPGGRTHLLSPAMAAAAAVTGRLTDVRELA